MQTWYDTRFDSNAGLIYSDSYLQVDFAALTAYAEGEPIEFTPLEFKFLELLVKNSG